MIRISRRAGPGSFLAGVILGVVALVAIASPAVAQSSTPPNASKPPTASNPSHWGAQVSFVTGWTMADQIKNALGSDPGSDIHIDGSEFEIGFVRGTRLGGDWGVSFVRKPFTDGSGETKVDQDCFNAAQTNCKPRTEVTATQDVKLTGVEVHWFIRVVNIKERLQVGLNIAGGIAQTSGQIVKTTDSFQPTGFNQNGPTGFTPVHTVEIKDAKDELFPYFPQAKLEVVGSFIVTPRFKIQLADGLNFPAISPRVMAVILF